MRSSLATFALLSLGLVACGGDPKPEPKTAAPTSEPQKQAAKAAFKTCLDLSVKHQYFDEFSRACEVWLAKNYGAEYHLIDEFRGSPSRVAAGLTDKPLPVNLDGTFFKADAPAPEEDVKSDAKGDAKSDSKSDAKGGTSDAGQSKEKSALDKATAKPKK